MSPKLQQGFGPGNPSTVVVVQSFTVFNSLARARGNWSNRAANEGATISGGFVLTQ